MFIGNIVTNYQNVNSDERRVSLIFVIDMKHLYSRWMIVVIQFVLV